MRLGEERVGGDRESVRYRRHSDGCEAVGGAGSVRVGMRQEKC